MKSRLVFGPHRLSGHLYEQSRRDLLLTGSGIVISSIVPIGRSVAQQPDSLGQPDALRQADALAETLTFLTTDPARNGQPDLDQLVQSWLTPTPTYTCFPAVDPPQPSSV